MATRTSSPPAERLVRAHRRRQQLIAAQAVRETRRLWRFNDWQLVATRALSTVRSALLEAARGAQAYVSAVIGDSSDPSGIVAEHIFADAASDGRPLDTLLGYPDFEVRAFVDQGMDHSQARAIGERHLERIVATQVADAARISTGVAVVNDQAVQGYIRLLTPPSCSRCIILAGRFYKYSAGFARHPQCFPAGILTSGPRTLAATRRWYEGELVVLATASGQQLSLTGNHPVLTSRGWVPAHLLEEGDEVVRGTRADGPTALTMPDEHQMPALVEDVWGSLGIVRSLGWGTADDFHGDGQYGQVDVVYADRALHDGEDLSLDEQFGQVLLGSGIVSPGSFDTERSTMLIDLIDAAHPGGAIGGGSLFLPGIGRHLGGAHETSLAGTATIHPGLLKSARDHIAAHAVLAPKGVLAGAGQVGGGDLLDRKRNVAARWDAPAGAFTVDKRGAYASRGLDLLQRLAGQIELDRVVDARRVGFRGHVHSLTSAEGWHAANSLIVSNCDCVHIPAAEAVDVPSPREVYDSLTDEQRRKAGWSGHDQRAIEDGADLNQVTNYRRELKSVTVAGRPVKATGAGFRGKRVRVRITPEQVYLEAERLHWNRDETLTALKRHGYIL